MLAIFFTWMAADDGAEIHEQCANYLGHFNLPRVSPWFFYLDKIKRFPTYYWQMLFGPFFLFMGIFMVYFLWKKLDGMKLRKYLIWGLICLIIAVGMDFFDGLSKSPEMIMKIIPLNKYTVIHFSRALEELFEMFGISLLWYLFLNYLSNICEGTKIKLKKMKE